MVVSTVKNDYDFGTQQVFLPDTAIEWKQSYTHRREGGIEWTSLWRPGVVRSG